MITGARWLRDGWWRGARTCHTHIMIWDSEFPSLLTSHPCTSVRRASSNVPLNKYHKHMYTIQHILPLPKKSCTTMKPKRNHEDNKKEVMKWSTSQAASPHLFVFMCTANVEESAR